MHCASGMHTPMYTPVPLAQHPAISGMSLYSAAPCAGFAVFLTITGSFVAAMAAVQTGPAYIIIRMLIGFNLATFVSNQYWTSVMFSPCIVGIANAFAGGWGNAGAHALS